MPARLFNQRNATRAEDQCRYAQQNWLQLSTHAHTLKSSARTVGALTLGDICNTIEHHAKQPNRRFTRTSI
ncbi:Hpt domain-containing protein [Cellvibrio sp. KY-YJ-3]|uniref:Hpt domain-containing protein n=1 Tax=Cellvibrio sp. KY-YJ-3 TaxID=454662 RepID=UPI001245F48A|nr:Hpt domain-containing protein [Cellvibrio sp. KY-YJ-3]